MAASAGAKSSQQLGFPFWLFGVPCVVIGAGLVLSPLWLSFARAGTTYALTSRRAIIDITASVSATHQRAAEHIRFIEVRQSARGSGDVLFHETSELVRLRPTRPSRRIHCDSRGGRGSSSSSGRPWKNLRACVAGRRDRSAPHPRPRARRRPGAPHGRRRQGADPHRRADHPRPRAGAAHAACTGIMLNANGDPARFAPFGLPVVPDDVEGFAGPLAGILAGLDWAAQHAPRIEWLVSVPGDCPFLPRDLVPRLHAARAEAGTAARLRAVGRLAPPGRRPVAGGVARRPAARPGGRRPAQDRGVDRAPRRCARGLAGRAGRPVLQRQHARGCGRGNAHFDRSSGEVGTGSPTNMRADRSMRQRNVLIAIRGSTSLEHDEEREAFVDAGFHCRCCGGHRDRCGQLVRARSRADAAPTLAYTSSTGARI